jgi:hypothetical protein
MKQGQLDFYAARSKDLRTAGHPTCPLCNRRAFYVGLQRVECGSVGCPNFVPPQATKYGPEAAWPAGSLSWARSLSLRGTCVERRSEVVPGAWVVADPLDPFYNGTTYEWRIHV